METPTATLGHLETQEQRPEPWRGKSVLVTGATGFLGNALVRRLAQDGARIAIINRDGYDPGLPFFAEDTCSLVDRVIGGDIVDFGVCQRAIVETRPDVLFHLAAVTQVGWCREMPLQALQTHVLGTANLLEACRVTRGPCAIVVASTDKVYGNPPPSEMPMRDDSPLRPEHPYDVSKASGDLVARSYGIYYGLPVTVTRCGNIYGPGDTNWDRLIPGTLRSLLLHQRPVVRSDGKQVREYNYVGDIVNAYLVLAEECLAGAVAPGSAWTISNGVAFAVMDVVRRCASTVGENLSPIVLGGAKDETPVLTLDAHRFSETFGWHPYDTDLDRLPVTASWLECWLANRRCIL